MPARLSPEVIEEALKLQSQCWTQQRIADHLGVDRRAIERHLRRINERALERLVQRKTAEKHKQIAQLTWMVDEEIQAWERSKEDAVTIKTTEESVQIGEQNLSAVETKTETTRKGQSGDSSHIAQARAALADIRSILGLDTVSEQNQKRVDAMLGETGTPSTKDALDEADESAGAFADDEQATVDPSPDDDFPTNLQSHQVTPNP